MKVFIKHKSVINSFDVTDDDILLIEKVKNNKPMILDIIKVNSQDEWFVMANCDDGLFLLELILRKDITNLFELDGASDDDVLSDGDTESIDILKPRFNIG